jgi:hypothetical protein
MTRTMGQLSHFGVPEGIGTKGLAVNTEVIVYDLDGLRLLLDMALDDEGRDAHFNALFDGIDVPDDPDLALLRRVHGHVIGNETLTDEDRAAVDPIFPVTVALEVADGPITVDKPYDLSTTDGTARVVSFTDVTLAQGGYFTCYSTPLLFSCDTLTRTGDSGGTMADFTIAGRTGAPQPTPAKPGTATQAASGRPGQCSSAGIAGEGGGKGDPGAEGTRGTDGAGGKDGSASNAATIRIAKRLTVTKPLTIFTQSGPGGKGGDGGPGGDGQQGGNGGNGVTCECTGNGGGPGGPGGKGGPGGRAGDGGNGVDADQNIVVYVPTGADVSKVTWTSASARPGDPGSPGTGGTGGKGGGASSGGKNNSGGGAGGDAGPGDPGGVGNAGTITGKAAKVEVQPL